MSLTATRTTRRTLAKTRAERWHEDTAVVRVFDDTATDDWNNPSEDPYSNGDSYSVKYDPGAAQEVFGDTAVDVMGDVMWMPLSALDDVDETENRLRLTHRYGSALSTALTFEIKGPPLQFANQLAVEVRTITT